MKNKKTENLSNILRIFVKNKAYVIERDFDMYK